jgi:hypothetical protein
MAVFLPSSWAIDFLFLTCFTVSGKTGLEKEEKGKVERREKKMKMKKKRKREKKKRHTLHLNLIQLENLLCFLGPCNLQPYAIFTGLFLLLDLCSVLDGIAQALGTEVAASLCYHNQHMKKET